MPDGLYVWFFALPLDRLFEHLGRMAAAWAATGVWPSLEEEVLVVLIPKVAGGERPIGLFLSVVWLVAKK